MEYTEKMENQIIYLMKEMDKVGIHEENIIGMLSMLDTEERLDMMVELIENTENLTEEKFVKAVIIAVRKNEKKKKKTEAEDEIVRKRKEL